jgi:hypothetical protein
MRAGTEVRGDSARAGRETGGEEAEVSERDRRVGSLSYIKPRELIIHKVEHLSYQSAS